MQQLNDFVSRTALSLLPHYIQEYFLVGRMILVIFIRSHLPCMARINIYEQRVLLNLFYDTSLIANVLHKPVCTQRDVAEQLIVFNV